MNEEPVRAAVDDGPTMTMRFRKIVLAIAMACVVSPCVAETPAPSLTDDIARADPDIDIYALMSGRCPTLRIAGHDFACRTIGFFHGEHGRVSFTVVLDDPADATHIISFSGINGQRSQDNIYELPVDSMLLKSKDRPKADGLPVPLVELSAGTCEQVGSFAARKISSISCSARDRHGQTYQLKFESDGSPIIVRRIRQTTAPNAAQDPFN
ncbi:hypothetical protein [Bradyrhizobium sp.]|uniref:hypothetical protein n=1 Tax=Bradyrhizobium sp. TaxID=376 RepID=UPI003C612FFF